jgi:hypothetical protein
MVTIDMNRPPSLIVVHKGENNPGSRIDAVSIVAVVKSRYVNEPVIVCALPAYVGVEILFFASRSMSGWLRCRECQC